MIKICELWTVNLWYELNPRVRCDFGNVSSTRAIVERLLVRKWRSQVILEMLLLLGMWRALVASKEVEKSSDF